MTNYEYALVSRYLTLAGEAAVAAARSTKGNPPTAEQYHELAQVDVTCAALVNNLAEAKEVRHAD